MDIVRVNSYVDNRFSQKVLYQHGCFLVDGDPYEIEILSDCEAVVRGKRREVYGEVIEQFLFFAPHITIFYDEAGGIIKEYPRVEVLELSLEELQPSQFYVDREKINAISTFIEKGEDIIIQVSRFQDRYISLDGHTRLYYAVMHGFEKVRAVPAEIDDCIYDFVKEAQNRNINTPKDLILVSHQEYEEKWNQYCDDYFSAQQ